MSLSYVVGGTLCTGTPQFPVPVVFMVKTFAVHNFLWEISQMFWFYKARPRIGAFLYKNFDDHGRNKDGVWGGRTDGNNNECVLIAYFWDGIQSILLAMVWIWISDLNFAIAVNAKSVPLTKVHGRKDDGVWGRRAGGRTVIIILYPHSRMNVSWLPTIGMGYDIECHIGSDISNNGRWRKDSGFDVQIQGASPAHIQGVPIKLALPALSKNELAFCQ